MKGKDILRLSHSKRARARKCLRYYHLYDQLRWTPRFRPPYFAFGTAIHEGIRAWYEGLPTDNVVETVFKREVEFDRLNASQQDRIQIDIAKAQGILKGYFKFWSDDMEKWVKIIPEKDPTVRINVGAEHFEGTPYFAVDYYGKIDNLLQDDNGDWWVKETKTTSENIDDFVSSSRLNAQLSSYMVLAKSVLGVWPKGILFDIIKKSQISRRKKESLQAFQRRAFKLYAEKGGDEGLFRREKLLFSSRDVKVWKREIRYEAEDILDAIRRARYPMNYESCKGKYGLCDLFPICSSGKISKQRFKKRR